jgi:ATP-binding cassette subfamily B (MDR/TAP) protein 6
MYLLDGLAFVIYAVTNKYWPQYTGLVAFSGLAALGSWKEVHGVDVSLLRQMRIPMFLCIVLDATQVARYHGTSTIISQTCDVIPHIGA